MEIDGNCKNNKKKMFHQIQDKEILIVIETGKK